MLSSIFRFELGYQTKGAGFFAIFGIFFLLVFGSVVVDSIQIGASEAVNINSPGAATVTIGIMSLFGMFIPVVMMATGVTRDKSLKTDEMFGSLPVSPRTMLTGRYFGGLFATFMCFAAIPLGFTLGTLMPWLDPENLGPHRLDLILYIAVIIGGLNMLIIGTLLFTVANMTRSLIATWVALVALLIGYVIANLIAGQLEARTTAALMDPFGLSAYGEITRYWTAAEQNTQAVPLTGIFLQNRLLWGGIALALLALNIALPKGIRGPSFARFKKETKSPLGSALREVTLPRVEPAPLYSSNLQQFARRTRFEVFGIVRSVAFWIVLALSVFNTVGSLAFLQSWYGAQALPVTRLTINAIEGTFVFVPLIIAVYYTAELIWRERTVKFNEIIDATPTPSWVFVGSKYLSTLVVLVLLATFAALTAIISQLVRGYTILELDQYAVRLFFFMVINFGLLTVLALFFQVLLNNKWAGIGAILAYFVLSIAVSEMGFNHWLYTFGSGINLNYSDMDGYGSTMYPTLVMSAYWIAFSVILGLVTFALWSRGSLDPMLSRFKRMPDRFSGGSLVALAVSVLVFAGLGGFVFYNTNVINTYMTEDQLEERAVAYEETYRQYEFTPMPSVIDVELTAELFPDDRRADLSVDYVIANKTDAPMGTAHVDYSRQVEVLEQSIEGATLTTEDADNAHYIFTFDPALQPGEERAMTASVRYDYEGFRNGSQGGPIRKNGTFMNSSLLPVIEWGSGKILTDRAERRKRELEEIPRLPKLEDEFYRNVGILGGADWIDFKATVTTDADQIAIAPGYLVSEETNGDRRTFVYEQDVPIQNFYSVQSAEYVVEEDVWRAPEGMEDVQLQVFYDEKHPYNVERMIEAMKSSFDVFTEVFTPFQYRQMRIQEFPWASFAQSFPNTVPYSENIGFITDLSGERDPDSIDPVTYVTAHEVAHQWFGHQLSAANVQGATMLIESFAQYGALLVMEEVFGREHMRRFLRYELDRYLSGRANEPIEEMPLYRVENQQYIHYQKGGHVMYLLRDQLGEEVVNSAVKRMIEEWGYRSKPYPRTTDFLAILREEAGAEHEQLIQDLFERIVLYDVDVTSAEMVELDGGSWEVTLVVDAKKLVADGEGNESEEPLSMDVDIGVFSTHPEDVKDGDDHIIAFERQTIVSGEQTIVLTVDEKPSFAGADPYNKLIDRRPENNVTEVEEASDEG
ncbi:hypothetical protein HK107_08980 [Parvularcula sp. ZS-1/3]|uniref:Peptidase M1 membrane alanine aminopeptidase domain-containing protein n=1 Tax=Parvularcula mediterranea TaxID=2732508 RepID=A0A7Y3RMS7_9PROT|nr:M1 family aminopeptidase [Parvularcula mediterranea]NNU16451.1 hypothetical protein [Parvularcula mediterranea]